VAAFEIMLGTSVITRLIREAKIHEIPSNIEMGKLEGMQTMNQALADLVNRGLVIREEAMMKSSDPMKLSSLLKLDRNECKVLQ
jgi:twitching motility protein PilT